MTKVLQLIGSIAVGVALVLGTAVITGAHVDTAKICASTDTSGKHGKGP
jgi:hypothetical protein